MIKISIEKVNAYNDLCAQRDAEIIEIRKKYQELFRELHLLTQEKPVNITTNQTPLGGQ